MAGWLKMGALGWHIIDSRGLAGLLTQKDDGIIE